MKTLLLYGMDTIFIDRSAMNRALVEEMLSSVYSSDVGLFAASAVRFNAHLSNCDN